MPNLERMRNTTTEFWLAVPELNYRSGCLNVDGLQKYYDEADAVMDAKSGVEDGDYDRYLIVKCTPTKRVGRQPEDIPVVDLSPVNELLPER